jgi:hypothetical protein
MLMQLEFSWTPVFTGVTTYYDFIKIIGLEKSHHSRSDGNSDHTIHFQTCIPVLTEIKKQDKVASFKRRLQLTRRYPFDFLGHQRIPLVERTAFRPALI